MSGDPSTIVALSGVGTLVTGFWLSRRGQTDTANQARAASAIAKQSAELDSWKSLALERANEIESLRSAAERQVAAALTAADMQTTRANTIQDRHDKDRERFQAELDRERAESAKHIHELAKTIALLRRAVVDEAKAEAAKDVVENIAGVDIDALLDD